MLRTRDQSRAHSPAPLAQRKAPRESHLGCAWSANTRAPSLCRAPRVRPASALSSRSSRSRPNGADSPPMGPATPRRRRFSSEGDRGRVRVSLAQRQGPAAMPPYLSPSPRRSRAWLCALVSATRLARVPCNARSLSPGLPAVREVAPSVAQGRISFRDSLSNCT